MSEKRYVARFDAVDNVSPKLLKMERNVRELHAKQEKLNQSLSRSELFSRNATRGLLGFDSKLERAGRSILNANTHMNSFMANGSRTMEGLVKKTTMLTAAFTSLPALIAGAGSALGALTLGDKVIGGALHQEMGKTQLMGLAGSDTLGESLYQSVKQQALDSTFSTKEYVGAAKSYMGFTKNESELAKVLDITKRLALYDPVQGFEGAALALKEGMSGDLMSLADRFEISRSALYSNGFDSGADPLSNLDAITRTLEGQGLTSSAVEKFESTGMAQLMALRSKSDDWFGQMGKDAVDAMKPVLGELNEFFTSPAATNFASVMNDSIGKSAERFTNYLDGVKWSDVQDNILLAKDAFTEMGRGAGILLDGLTGGDGKNPGDILGNLGRGLEGFTAGLGGLNDELQGAFTWFDESGWKKRVEKFADFGSRDETEGKRKGAAKWIYDGITGNGWETTRVDGSHMNGLSNVPFNGYVAELHKGERVLTAQENRNYSGGGGSPVTINNTFEVRNQQDAEAVAKEIVTQLRTVIV